LVRGKSSDRAVLVLGGAGFIGSHVATACAAASDRVVVIDAFLPDSGAREANLGEAAGRVRLIRGAVADVAELDTLVAESHVIVDAMALTAHHVGLNEPERDLEANLASHLRLIRALMNQPGKPVIYLGSRGQYGRVASARIDEDTPQVPLDPQGVHKSAAEALLRIYAARHGFHVVSLRLPNCFGERQNTRGRDLGLVGNFIRDLLQGRTVEVFGDATRKKSLVYGPDVASIVREISADGFAGFTAYNVAGHSLTLGALLDELIGIIGSGRWTVEPFPKDVRQIDVGDADFSDARLRERLGHPRVTPLRQALASTVAYFREGVS
jgi:nucleoside-diphosphate-sugar epimerase